MSLDLLGTFKGAITWLGGAVAGLTVLCYGAGYLALHTYLGMLGLDGIISVRSDQILIEGAEFWRWLVYKLVLSLGLVVILGMILALIVEQVRPLTRLRNAGRTRAQSAWKHMTKRFPRLASGAAVVLVLAALEIHSYSFDNVTALSASPPQLLFNDHPKSAYAIFTALDPEDLARKYFLLILLVFIAFSSILETRIMKRPLLVIRVAVGLYFTVYTLSLPGAYGVLLHKPIYPLAILSGPDLSAKGYLLSQDENSVLLWFPQSHTVAWLPIRRVNSIQAGRPRNIFA